jgi:hypothetical protein
MKKYNPQSSDVVYIAGPMRGYPKFNYPAFDKAEQDLTNNFFCKVISPANIDRQNGLNEDVLLTEAEKQLRQCISRDIHVILESVTCIAVLEGWQKSRGVAVEVALGKFLGLPIFEAATLQLIDDNTPGNTPADLTTKAVKYDHGKPRMELLSPWVLEEVAKVMTKGAQKYADHNWRLGFNWTRPIGACLRHVMAWLRGEDADAESGLPHLAHAICCLMFALEHQLLGMGVDDRWKQDKK